MVMPRWQPWHTIRSGRSCDGTSFTVPHAGQAKVGSGRFRFTLADEDVARWREARGDTKAVTPQMNADDPAAPNTNIEG